MSKYLDLVGEKFGLLAVISKAESVLGRTHFNCLCSCGNTTVASTVNLRKGLTTSCGCYRKNFRQLPKGEAAFNDLFYSYKWGAKKKGREFLLTKEEFRTITQSNCVYCGVSPNTERKVKLATNGTYLYNGVDRKDNSIGYTKENSQPCCTTCNQAKHTLTENQFLSWIDRLSTFQRNKNGS